MPAPEPAASEGQLAAGSGDPVTDPANRVKRATAQGRGSSQTDEETPYRPKWPMPPFAAPRKVDDVISRGHSGRGVTKLSLPAARDGTKLTAITVTLAAYQSLAAARADWDAFELAAESGSWELVDAALIERTLDEISEFHSRSPAGWGRGVIASAVCGVLWPPAMLVGALAGSVGGHTMTEVRRGLSRQAIGGLGAVMENGTFIVVAIAGPGSAPPALPGTRAVHVASFPLDKTAPALRAALDLDDAEDASGD
jgi:hypothetical protein